MPSTLQGNVKSIFLVVVRICLPETAYYLGIIHYTFNSGFILSTHNTLALLHDQLLYCTAFIFKYINTS